jgi:tetratricopeptide (TPR) repeat protein
MRYRDPFATAVCACAVALIAATSLAAMDASVPEEARAFAAKLETTLNACDSSLFDSSIAWEALVARGTADLEVPEPVRTEFAGGLARGFTLGDEICKTISESGSYTLLNVRAVDGEPRALFRAVGENGLNYHDLLLDVSGDGSVRITDLFIYSLGEWVSQTARRGFLPLVAQLEHGSLARMKKGENLYLDNVPKILKIQNHYQQEEYTEALAVFRSLPDELKSNRNILMLRFAVAVQLGGEEYDKAMLDLKTAFPDDPSLDLVLLDHYFNARQFDEALRIVDRIDRGVGGDPYLDFMRANLLYAAGRKSEARAAARRAVEREPGLEDPYWTLVTISLDDKDFGETAKLLDEIETALGLAIGDLSQIPEYSEFLESDAYDAWAASR